MSDELPKTAAYNVIAQTARDAKWESLDKQFISVADEMRDELLLHLNFSQSINDDCMRLKLEAEAEVERLRDGLRADSDSIVLLTARIAEYQDRVTELERELDDARNVIRVLHAEQLFGDDCHCIYCEPAHPDAKEGT